jgi:hypothetical protein
LPQLPATVNCSGLATAIQNAVGSAYASDEHRLV